MEKIRKLENVFAYDSKRERIVEILQVHEKEIVIYRWEGFFKKVPHSTKNLFLGIKYRIPGELGQQVYEDIYNKMEYWVDAEKKYKILRDQMQAINLNLK